MVIPASFDKTDLSRVSLETRLEFANQHRRNRTHLRQMGITQLIEYVVTDLRFFSDWTLTIDVFLECQANFLDDEHFINTMFRLTSMTTNTIRTMCTRPEFRERYENYEVFKRAIDSYCTYNCINVEGIDIHWDTVELMLDGPVGTINNFVSEFMDKLEDDPIDKSIAGELAGKYIRDAKTNLEYKIFSLSLNNLKVLCKSPAFQSLVARAYTKLNTHEPERASPSHKVIYEQYLKPNEENIIKTYRQSKLFR